MHLGTNKEKKKDKVLKIKKRKTESSWVWWNTPVIPKLYWHRQADLCEFKDNLVFRVSSRTAIDTQRNLVSKKGRKQSLK